MAKPTKIIVMGATVEYAGALNDTKLLQNWNLQQADIKDTKSGVRYAILK